MAFKERDKVSRKFQRAVRRRKHAQLLLKGYTARQISQELGITLQLEQRERKRLVQREIKLQGIALHEWAEWMKLKLLNLEKTLWEVFEASKVDHKGNPRTPNALIIDQIRDVYKDLRDLLGLDAPKKVEVSASPVNQLDWNTVTQGKQLPAANLSSESELIESLKDDIDKRIMDLERVAQETERDIENDMLKGNPRIVVVKTTPNTQNGQK